MNNSELRKVLEKLIRVELASNIQGILLSSRGEGWQKRVNDNNLFFTLSASFLFYGASSPIRTLIDNSILKELKSYKNKDGKATYNFWRTNPYEQFPTNFFLSRIKRIIKRINRARMTYPKITRVSTSNPSQRADQYKCCFEF